MNEFIEDLSIIAGDKFLKTNGKYPTLSDAVADVIKTAGTSLNPKQIKVIVHGANNYVYQSMFKRAGQPITFKIAKLNEVLEKLNVPDKIEKTASDMDILEGAVLDEQIEHFGLLDEYLNKLASNDPIKNLDTVPTVPIYKIKDWIEKISEDINMDFDEVRNEIFNLREKLAEDLKNRIIGRDLSYLSVMPVVSKIAGKFGTDILAELETKLDAFKYSEDIRTIPTVKVNRFPEKFEFELKRYKNLNEFLYKLSRLRSLTNTEMDYVKTIFKECPSLVLRLDKESDRNMIIKIAQLGVIGKVLKGGWKTLKGVWKVLRAPGKMIARAEETRIGKTPGVKQTLGAISQLTPLNIGFLGLFGTGPKG